MKQNDQVRETSLPGGEPDRTPPPREEGQVLSPKRRSALVTYLAILFAVAFLFVAVTMGLEAKRLKTANQELQDSSNKTSASLTGSVNALQAENQALRSELETLKAEADERMAELATTQIMLEEREVSLEELREHTEEILQEKSDLEQALANCEEALEYAVAQADDAVTVSELLHQAMAADEAGDLATLRDLLDRIEQLKDLLSPTETALFEELKIA